MLNSYKILIQARMSSSRFPGKVLAPFNNEPMIKSTIDRCRRVNSLKHNDIVVVTSDHSSDDILCLYCESIKCEYYRGNLNNVTDRFIGASFYYGINFIIRISGDSPLIDPDIISYIINNHDSKSDLTTNVYPRTFPKGQSVEIVSSKTLQNIIVEPDFDLIHAEHVTKYIYDNYHKYNIKNISNESGDLSKINYSVDTVEDYNRLKLK